jgi:hypothetical protein
MKKIYLLAILGLAFNALAGDFPRTMFVENNLARTLSMMNLETGAIRNNVLTLGQVSNQILAYRDQLFVLNSVPAEIMVIDAVTQQLKSRIALPEGSNPYNMALVGSRRLYVSLLAANAVAVVDVKDKRLLKLIETGKAPEGILVDGDRALVANTGGYPGYKESTIAIVDTRTDSVLTRLAVPTNPQALCKGPDWNYYALCSGIWGKGGGQLVSINPYGPPDYNTTVVADTFQVGGFPSDVVVLGNGTAYICDWGDMSGGFLYKVDIYNRQVLHDSKNPIRVGRGAMRLFLDKFRGDLYVSAFDQDIVQKFDVSKDQVSATYPMGDGCQNMAIVEKIAATDPWADEVVDFTPGQPWSKAGYDFFPENVLGPPDPDENINTMNSARDLDEVLSLGNGGQITLAFTDNVVYDGPGVDFIVFENVFLNLWTGQPFMETARVEVSKDGINFVSFPYDTVALTGLAGMNPVKSTLNPTNPELSGADAFDLATVGLEWIRYVRLTDMGDLWKEGPYNGDFDLDAVVAVNSKTNVEFVQAPIQPDKFRLANNYPNPFNGQTCLRFETEETIELELAVCSMTGQVVRILRQGMVTPGSYTVVWDGRNSNGENVSSGVYWAVLKAGSARQCQKMIHLK